MNRDSDLVGIPVAGGLTLGVLAVLFAYFFVGVWLGTVLLIGLVVLGIVLIVRGIRANEVN